MLEQISTIDSSDAAIYTVLAVKKCPKYSQEIVEVVSLKTQSSKLRADYNKLLTDPSVTGEIEDVESSLKDLFKLISKYGQIGPELSDYLLTHERFTKKRSERLDDCYKAYGMNFDVDFRVIDRLANSVRDSGLDPKKMIKQERKRLDFKTQFSNKLSDLATRMKSDGYEIDKICPYLAR